MMSLAYQDLNLQVSNIQPDYKNWEGDLIELNGHDKDTLCYAFLLKMTSWWDDVLPPTVVNQQEFLDILYNTNSNAVSHMLKDAIYLTLEPTLRDLVQEIYDELNHVQPEPFAGYERGQ